MGRKPLVKQQMKITDLSEESPSLLRADPVMETFGFKANMKKGDLTAGVDLTANTQQGSAVNTALAVLVVGLVSLATWAGVAGMAAWVGLGAVACVSVGGVGGLAVLVGGGYLVYRSSGHRKKAPESQLRRQGTSNPRVAFTTP